jgi:YHS domain-containing protein
MFCIRTIRILATSLALGALSLGAIAIATPAHADTRPVYTAFASNVAVGGYDPVAFFTVGKPVRGDAKFTATYKGAEVRFSSAANRATFLAAPDKYFPQYGGYCAWAVSQGYTAKGDPDFWKIVDGKLYLNFNNDVQKKWEKDIPGFVKAGDANWPKVLAK